MLNSSNSHFYLQNLLEYHHLPYWQFHKAHRLARERKEQCKYLVINQLNQIYGKRKDGKNPDVWDGSVDVYLLKKSDPDFYNDPVVKYGYCRGVETYNYVSQILDRYEHYKNILKD